MAMGFLEVAGYGAALYAMDGACKATNIEIIGIDATNPLSEKTNIPLSVQVKFVGSVSEVEAALEVATRLARELNEEKDIITHMIANPYEGTKQLGSVSKVKIQK